MKQSELRILLNAEPFGFGPAAAVASVVPQLKQERVSIDYIGEKHTLDLQRDLPYDSINDVTGMSLEDKFKLFSQLTLEYDLFFTAMDFEMAELAEQAGLKTVIYDALTWYWPTIPAAVKNSDLYLAQNFFGVEERVQSEPHSFPVTKIVSPIVSSPGASRQARYVLINLGGLQNPIWKFEDTVLYAQLVLATIRAHLPRREELIITTSSAIVRALDDPAIRPYGRQEMMNILEKTKYAFMTPGLGNIYDAAAYNIPTLWLPPANDSQGRQADLLSENHCCDERIDWSDFARKIDYSAPQREVLNCITDGLKNINRDSSLKRKFDTITASKISRLASCHESKAHSLVTKFGLGGAEEISKSVIEIARSQAYVHA